MKSFYIVFLVIFIVYGCTKEDENITTIKGIALFNTKEPVTEGIIEITGIDHGAFYIHNFIGERFSRTTTINTDGTFNLQVNPPENVDDLIITVDIPGGPATTMCSPIPCHLLKPGKDYDLTIKVIP